MASDLTAISGLSLASFGAKAPKESGSARGPAAGQPACMHIVWRGWGSVKVLKEQARSLAFRNVIGAGNFSHFGTAKPTLGGHVPRMAAIVRRFLLVAVRVVGVYTQDRTS